VLEKHGAQDSSSPGCCGPEFPTLILFSGHAKDKCLFAVFCVGSTFVWLAVYKGLHPDWNKWTLVVVVVAIDVGIGG
jgi:hypothetical protein